MTVVAGMDGCPGGWLCLWGDAETGPLQGRVLVDLEELLNLAPRPQVVGVDIPIGLPAGGSRACDREARRLLGRPRGSSVFPAPIRPMLAAESYAEACAIGERVHGRKLSKQAWNLVPKIRAMDDFLRADPARPGWIREVHPELSFALWNNGSPIAHGKTSPEGAREREDLARAAFGADWAALRDSLPRVGFADNDLRDALAVLWSAQRIATGVAARLPREPEWDPRGLPMEILA